MSETPKSKAEMVIERIMGDLDPGSDRYQVLATAKQFKSSWVELGSKLQQVQQGGLFRDWGYDSFEDYCSREIRIKRPTAEKLTLAYRYMEKEEPELLARQGELKPLPDYRSVDLLRQARQEKDFSDEEYAELRKAVVEDDRSHPTVLKRFKEVSAAHGEGPGAVVLLKSGLNAARRLEGVIDQLDQVSTEQRRTVSDLIRQLEREVEAAQSPPV
ncbi:MAG: hypothetical protein C0617_11030, partial [Desulfuromonas sp.]|uniref:hypothetical protein n=1 Tax=Desulfuromonas sp. TaxID=892 RepID=UPI000CBD1B5B